MKKLKQVPLTETTYLILLALIEPLHGYGIMQKVEAMSNNRVKMGPGTLYGGLSSLVDKKMIRRVEIDIDEDRKKLYELTNYGMDILKNEYLRLKQLVDIGKRILLKEQKNG